jgi:hypothetical protein
MAPHLALSVVLTIVAGITEGKINNIYKTVLLRFRLNNH